MAHSAPKAAEAPRPHAMLAEFESPGAVLHAAEALRSAGYSRLDALTPFPVHGLDHALGIRGSKVPWLVLGGAVFGGVAGLGLQVWTSAVDYPIRIAGKPFMSLPAFVPVTFELTVLFSAFAAVFGMLALNGLPRLFHPTFRHPRVHRATDDRFFLVVEASDPRYAADRTRKDLEEAGGKNVEEVED